MNQERGLFSQYRGLRKELYILFFGRIVTNFGSMVWPMMTMILSQKMGMSASGIAVYMVVSSLIMIPTNLLGGRLADRYNKKNIIVAGDTASIVCYLLCAVFPLSTATIVLMVLAGICQSMEYPAYDALTADLSATRDRERAYSLLYLGANLGLVLSPTIGGILFKDYLWLMFLLSALSIGCSTLLIFFKIKDITPEPDEDEAAAYQAGRSSDSLLTILKENRVILLMMVILSSYYATYGMYNYLMPLDMGRVHGENGAVIFGTVSSLNCIVVVLFTPVITRLFARVRDTGKILIGQLFVTAGYLMFLLLLGHVPAYYAAMLLFTWGEIFVTIAEGPYLTSRIPASHRGRINALHSVLGTAIFSVFDLLIGRLYDGSGSTAAWTLVLAMLAFVMILTVILGILDRKAYPKLYRLRRPHAAEEE